MSHDISGDKIKLDLNMLISTAEIAAYELQQSLFKTLNLMYDRKFTTTDADFLEKDARALSLAMKTWHALQATKTRNLILITNGKIMDEDECIELFGENFYEKFCKWISVNTIYQIVDGEVSIGLIQQYLWESNLKE